MTQFNLPDLLYIWTKKVQSNPLDPGRKLNVGKTLKRLHKKWSFPLRISADSEEILNGKLHFLCSERRPGGLLNVVSTFNSHPLSSGNICLAQAFFTSVLSSFFFNFKVWQIIPQLGAWSFFVYVVLILWNKSVMHAIRFKFD